MSDDVWWLLLLALAVFGALSEPNPHAQRRRELRRTLRGSRLVLPR